MVLFSWLGLFVIEICLFFENGWDNNTSLGKNFLWVLNMFWHCFVSGFVEFCVTNPILTWSAEIATPGPWLAALAMLCRRQISHYMNNDLWSTRKFDRKHARIVFPVLNCEVFVEFQVRHLAYVASVKFNPCACAQNTDVFSETISCNYCSTAQIIGLEPSS